MRKLFRAIVVLLFVLAVVSAAPASACNQRCNWSTGDCEFVGYTTYMACDEVGSSSCMDVPVSGCYSASAEDEYAAAFLMDTPTSGDTLACASTPATPAE